MSAIKQKEHVLIKAWGRVQGVFYRRGVQNVAEGLGLRGYAQNNPDGSVTIEAEGDTESLRELIEWCSVGTESAQVERVETEWGEALQYYMNFEVR